MTYGSHHNTWPGAIFVYFTRITLFTKLFNMTMRYPQWNYKYITVQSFVFAGAIVSEVGLLKRKKKK